MPTFRDCAAVLAANGYLPVPIRARSKAPIPEQWQRYVYLPGDELKFGDAGVGIRAGEVVPVDCDVRDAELASAIERMALATFGAAPRRIGLAPKVALLYRTDKPFAKLRSVYVRLPGDAPGAKPHGVEILGLGQQLVIYGIHPDTRADYLWNGAGEPLEVAVKQLETISESEAYHFLQRVNELLLEHGTPVGKIAQRDHDEPIVDAEREAFNRDECALAIDAIRNADLHYDDWIYIGLAIKGALGDAGKAAWHHFSAQSSKYSHDETERAWKSFAPTHIGAGTLYRLAFDAGWNRPTYGVDLSGLLNPQAQPAPLLLDIEQLRAAVGQLRWLVKHAIPANSLGIVYGPSGSFKSFIVLDLALHIAHGLPWLNRKTGQGPVVYVAAEGGTGLVARVDAWHRKHGLAPGSVPFRVCKESLMLDHARDLKSLSDAIADAGIGDPALIVLDTMSQTMSGDENEARDTANYLRGIGTALRARFGSTVMPVHHTGHSAGDRPRGSSVIKGNVDFLFAVTREEGQMLAVLECKKQKDGDNGGELPFNLERLEVGHDDDGDPLTSLVATYHDNAAALLKAAKQPKTFTNNQRWLFDLITPEGRLYGEVRDEFYALLGEDKADTKKKAFARAMTALVEGGFVMEKGALLTRIDANE